MEQEEKWMRFAATGKIADYLDYRSGGNVNLDGKITSKSESKTGDFDSREDKSEEFFGSNKVN